MEFRLDVRCGNSLLCANSHLFKKPQSKTGSGQTRENSRQTDGRFLAGAILSKDAVFYLATDARIAPLIEFAECDEVVGGR